jgi:hypothetical protein
MKQTITQNEYLILIALSALAHGYNEKLSEIVAVAAAIAEADDTQFGHMADMIYGEYGVDEQLEKLGIRVQELGDHA